MERGFAVVKKYAGAELNLPKRATEKAAGYDFEAAEDFVLPSIWKMPLLKIFRALRKNEDVTEIALADAQEVLKPLLVPTGIKAYMGPNEYLMIANRSSNPLKRGLILPNGVGIIDADYVDNDKNEGEIFIQMTNWGVKDVLIKKGERIGQGIFMPFLLTDDDAAQAKRTRTGGFGSSGVQ
jgi:dUTP pyrophosphatase